MVPFLKGFLKNLTTVQSKQLLRVLTQMKDRGEIRSPEEFEKKLADLASLIQKDALGQRTPLLTFNDGDLLDSSALRDFLEGATLDLEAALGETERLGSSIRAHSKILSQNYFDALETALSELESDTRAYEVLENQKFTGFSSVIKRYTFDGSMSVPGGDDDDPFLSDFFSDLRGPEDIIYSAPYNGELGLRLGILKDSPEKQYYFDKIEILNDSTTPQTALSTSTGTNTPVKAIDGNLDTAWRHSVLLTSHPNACRLIMAPSFVSPMRVNAVVIDSLADVAMRLVSIDYIDSGGRQIQLPVGSGRTGVTSIFDRSLPIGTQALSNTNWVLPNKRKIFSVGNIIAKKLIITFQQDTGGDGEFFYYDEDVGRWNSGKPPTEREDPTEDGTFRIEAAITSLPPMVNNSKPSGMASLPSAVSLSRKPAFGRTSSPPPPGSPIRQVSSSSGGSGKGGTPRPGNYDGKEIPEELGFISESAGRLTGKFFEYVFGLKEISTLDREFASNGLFVPEPFEIKAPAVLALYTDLESPSSEYTDIEFTIKKHNYDADGLFLDSELFPVLPYGATVVNERFFPTEGQPTLSTFNAGNLRFYPDFDESFTIYRDGTALTLGTDYQISVDGGATYETSLPLSGTPSVPQKCLIKLSFPHAGNIHVVSYSPLLSSSTAGSEVWMNRDKTTRLGRNQTYVFENSRANGEVARSKIALQILIRSNTSNSRVSPYLREVVLLGG